jgi:alanine or glycine:cation symporter, AGCS family
MSAYCLSSSTINRWFICSLLTIVCTGIASTHSSARELAQVTTEVNGDDRPVADVAADVVEVKAATARIAKVDPHTIPLPEVLPVSKADVEKAERASKIKSGEIDEKNEPSKGWIADFDGWFGRYVVKPMDAILFFDFGTKEYLGVKIPFVVVWLLLAGIFLTIRMGLINVRGFWHAIELVRGKFDADHHQGDVSHFQALSSALSGTVGLGNIAGVSIAIGIGGPGATFWMILSGFLGMTTKFAECSLAVMYRSKDEDGMVLGGPMIYLKEGLGRMGLGGLGKVLAIVFTFLCIGGSFGGGNSYQVSQSLNALKTEPSLSFLNDYPWIYGLAMTVMVGIVIIGGIKSIGNFAGAVVPFMCIAYMSVCIAILCLNYRYLPTAAMEIISGALSPSALYGGFLGVMVIGIKRAVFSNEAGAGSAAIAHSAAKTDKPISEGMVALLEPFIDTVLVCTLTALTIVCTGVYRQPDVLQMAQDSQGSMITLAAFTQNASYDWFRYVLYLAVFLFAYSTCVSWSYYGERCFVSLFGKKSSLFYKVLFLSFTFLGSVITPQNILDFSDMLILAMSVPNLIGVFLMSNLIRRELDRYWLSYKNGEMKPAS